MKEKPKLQLTSCDGNAFAVLGKAKAAASKAGWDKETAGSFMNEAMSGDYDHLLKTCMKYFEVS